MASDISASLASVQNSITPDPIARRNRRRETATHALANFDRDMFILRRLAHGRDIHTNLIKSSAIKLAESQRLLAEVDALLRR